MRRLKAAALFAGMAAALVTSGCYAVPIDYGRPTSLPPPVASGPPAATQLQARLYRANDIGSQTGVLSAQIADTHAGRGTLSVGYRGGVLQGEATRVDSNYSAFGRVHDQVLGAGSRSYAGRRGVANAYGSAGVSVQCEYVLTSAELGTGVCLFSDGAKYQFHFGS